MMGDGSILYSPLHYLRPDSPLSQACLAVSFFFLHYAHSQILPSTHPLFSSPSTLSSLSTLPHYLTEPTEGDF